MYEFFVTLPTAAFAPHSSSSLLPSQGQIFRDQQIPASAHFLMSVYIPEDGSIFPGVDGKNHGINS